MDALAGEMLPIVGHAVLKPLAQPREEAHCIVGMQMPHSLRAKQLAHGLEPVRAEQPKNRYQFRMYGS